MRFGPGCACCASISTGRRQFLAASGAVAVAAAAPQVARAAKPQRFIDMHHHFEPSGKNFDGAPWSIENAVEQLERNNVATAIGWPGPIFAPDAQAGRKRARDVNEWGTKICLDHPGRFGMFAAIPMNDPDTAITEIAYALDVLHADGIGLSTNYGGAWLGDAKFEPIFQEMNRRKAVVYVHPFGAPCCTPETLTYETGAISTPWIEFPTNTARTILSLWAAGTPRRMPDIKFLFCHGGGVMPVLLGRFAGFNDWPSVGKEKLDAMFPQGVYAEFARLYFECAQAYAPETIAMLRRIVPPTHLLFGTDYSYFPVAHAVDLFGKLDLPDAERNRIKGGNAAALLPKWRT